MKLDLLKKLTALANNNPNDNEANLAARKVCLMLAECKFILPIEQPKASVRPQSPPAQNWNDVKRSEEPEFKSYYYGTDPEFNPFRDIFERMYNSPRPKPKQEPKPEPSQTRENPFRTNADIFDFDLDDIIGRHVNVKIPRQDPKGFKESKFRSFDPANNIIEADCILCQRWCRVSKVAFEHVKGCYVCPECEGKSK